MGFSRQEYWSGLPCPPPGVLPNPGIECRSPALQADSFPSEQPGKPMNTGVGSLSLLQGIFPTQELNRALPHCRQILYQLSYQGSPITYFFKNTIGESRIENIIHVRPLSLSFPLCLSPAGRVLNAWCRGRHGCQAILSSQGRRRWGPRAGNPGLDPACSSANLHSPQC